MSTYETKDTGVREEQGTGAVRDSRKDKGRYDLLPAHAIRRLAQVYERGAEKYSDRNWEKGMSFSRYMDSALRHIFQHLEGRRDEDHLGHAVFNLLAIMEHQERIERGTLPTTLDDLPVPIKTLADQLKAEQVLRVAQQAAYRDRLCKCTGPTEQPRIPGVD
jgi:hypothetical protein